MTAIAKELKEQGLRRVKHGSSYFQGAYNRYGRYQWDIKFNGFNDNAEIESAQFWAFGDYSYKTGSFDQINELLGREIKASIQGRSGGWFVIDTELSKAELKKIDKHISACMRGLPKFLEEERKMLRDAEREAELEQAKRQKEVENSEAVKKAVKLLESFAGSDLVLMVKGVKVK